MKKKRSIVDNLRYVIARITEKQSKLLWMMVVLGCVSAISAFILPVVSKQIIDHVIDGEGVTEVLIFVGLLFLLQIVLTSFEGYFSLQVWWRTIRSRMNFETLRIERFMSLKYAQLEDQKVLDSAQKAACATRDNSSGIEGFLRAFQTLLADILKMVLSIGIISSLNPVVAVIMFALAYAGYRITDIARKKDKQLTWDILPPYDRKRNYFRNTSRDFAYAKDVRMFRMQKLILNKENKESGVIHGIMRKSNNRWIFYSALIHLVLLVNELVIYVWLINRVVNHGLDMGNFSLYLATFRTFFSTISSFLDSLSQMKKNSAEVSDFREFLEDQGEEKECGKELTKEGEYVISFRNVSFKYPDQSNYILKNISFEIGLSDRIAVVGANGAGKSTIIKLLCRLYDVSEGEILINGENINNYKREDCFSLFAPVFQDVNLFAFSVAENIAMEMEESINADKMQNALKKADVEELVGKLPQGLNTKLFKVLDENGVDLSGGEKQEIATARAIYKEAPVVIFDEPTAALDPIAEKVFYETINNKVGKKSVIYISHRLSSTRFCNTILFLADGEIKERGTHQELLNLDGEYAKLYRMQAQYYQNMGSLYGGVEVCEK